MLKKWKQVGLARAQIKIKNIKDGVVVLSDQRYRVILKTSAVNFGLKGEAEQDALIDAFERVLNGLSHPVQILIRTRKMDVQRYLQRLEQLEKQENQRVYKQQLERYREFIRLKVEQSRILSRRFYVVVPFDAKSQQEEMSMAMKSADVQTDSDKEAVEDVEFQLAKQQLAVLSTHLIEELQRVRIRIERMNNDEVMELFYTCFNPGAAIGKPLNQRRVEDEIKIKMNIF